MSNRISSWLQVIAVLATACGGVAADGARGSPDARPTADAAAPELDATALVRDAAIEAAPTACSPDGSCYLRPCTTTAECNDRYLECVPMPASVINERGGRAGEATGLCLPRFDEPCRLDTDCGPGFVCALDGGSKCQTSGCVRVNVCSAPPKHCASVADCPVEWSCSYPGLQFCNDAGECKPFPKQCTPPFVVPI